MQHPTLHLNLPSSSLQLLRRMTSASLLPNLQQAYSLPDFSSNSPPLQNSPKIPLNSRTPPFKRKKKCTPLLNEPQSFPSPS
ncbi:hypothetical protein LR48_Vigan02g168500 [Vigna angularis]|uniref:Uncharacterized protein n=1 Tax=Phaseolus angularis TaxID=3914 RepID=A0A0L9TYC1_PHAAN|nr:hypothetical protein LR48_Vigan02g168500 [Vigna angularis]